MDWGVESCVCRKLSDRVLAEQASSKREYLSYQRFRFNPPRDEFLCTQDSPVGYLDILTCWRSRIGCSYTLSESSNPLEICVRDKICFGKNGAAMAALGLIVVLAGLGGDFRPSLGLRNAGVKLGESTFNDFFIWLDLGQSIHRYQTAFIRTRPRSHRQMVLFRFCD